MELEEIRNISVLGAGIMGHGIAQSFIMGGYTVTLYDISESVLNTAKSHIKENLERFRKFGLIGNEEVDPAFKNLSTTTDLKTAVWDSDFIIEAAPEILSLKKDLFEQVESFCKADAILATNSSSLTLKDIGERVQNKKRLIVTHWFNPPHIVPTVEVVKGEETTDEVMETVYSLLEKIKKTPVKILKDIPGFLVNRIQIAMVREILDLYEQGVACAEDIDKAVKGSIGFRLASIGPLLTIDLGGARLWFEVSNRLLPRIRSTTTPSKALQEIIDQGHDGIKSGKGFYDYSTDFTQDGLDRAISDRDDEFLNRLKNLYWKMESDD